MSVTIGICIAAIFVFICLLLGIYYLFYELRKQAIHRDFLSAFLSAKAGSKATARHLPYQLRETYLAQKILGKGAFGCVVRVQSKQGSRRSAIKIILPEKDLFDGKKNSPAHA